MEFHPSSILHRFSTEQFIEIAKARTTHCNRKSLLIAESSLFRKEESESSVSCANLACRLAEKHFSKMAHNSCPKCGSGITGGGKTCGSCGAVGLSLLLKKEPGNAVYWTRTLRARLQLRHLYRQTCPQ